MLFHTSLPARTTSKGYREKAVCIKLQEIIEAVIKQEQQRSEQEKERAGGSKRKTGRRGSMVDL
jgi:hypothetical protein